MKKIFCTLFILISLKVFSQPSTPTGYTKLNMKYDLKAGKFSTLTIPSGGTTATLYGGWTGAGGVYWDSVNKALRIWDGHYFHSYSDSAYKSGTSLVVHFGNRNDTITGLGGGGTTTTKMVNYNDSIQGTGNIRTRTNDNVTLFDNSTEGYEGFPFADALKDIAVFAWKRSTTHAGRGPLMLARSRDGLRSVDSTWQLKVSGTPDTCTNLAFGVIKTGAFAGRVVVQWIDATISDSIIHVAYSTDTMRSWTAGTNIIEPINSRCFGRIRQIQADTLISHGYSVGASIDSSYIHRSVDGGVTWGVRKFVAQSSTQSYNEADLQYLGNGKIIYIVRSESPLNRPSQFTSTDDGNTWTRQGGLNALNFVVNNTPTFVEKYDNKLWLLSNFRDGSGNNSVWWYSYGLEGDVFTDTSKWAKRSAYYHPYNDDVGNATLGIENGYTVPFQLGGRLYVVGYDNSPFETSSVTAKARSFVMPIVGNGDFVKVYKNSNQSISNNTATSVTFDNIDMNDDLLFNTDSGYVIFKRDGWYEFHSVVTFDTSNAGTYRQCYAFVDAAIYGAAAFDQPQTISMKTITGHQNNFDFNRIELNGVYFFRRNEKLKIFVKQDSGGSLNIVNTVPDRRARLIVKRIRVE